MEHIDEYEKNTIRALEWFTKKRGNLVGEEELVNIDLMKLREIFNVKDSFDKGKDEPYEEAYDPYMSYGYEINEAQAKALQPYVKHKINLNKYDYFVASYERV